MNALKTGRILIIALAYALPACTPEDRPSDPPATGASQEDNQFDTLGITFVEVPCEVRDTLKPPVMIGVDVDNNSVTVSKQLVVLCRGEEMEWTKDSTVQSWEVTWKRPGNSPLYPGGPISSGPDGTGRGLAVAVGAFEYAIRVVTPSGDTLRRDPDVVILPGMVKEVSP